MRVFERNWIIEVLVMRLDGDHVPFNAEHSAYASISAVSPRHGKHSTSYSLIAVRSISNA